MISLPNDFKDLNAQCNRAANLVKLNPGSGIIDIFFGPGQKVRYSELIASNNSVYRSNLPNEVEISADIAAAFIVGHTTLFKKINSSDELINEVKKLFISSSSIAVLQGIGTISAAVSFAKIFWMTHYAPAFNEMKKEQYGSVFGCYKLVEREDKLKLILGAWYIEWIYDSGSRGARYLNPYLRIESDIPLEFKQNLSVWQD